MIQKTLDKWQDFHNEIARLRAELLVYKDRLNDAMKNELLINDLRRRIDKENGKLRAEVLRLRALLGKGDK